MDNLQFLFAGFAVFWAALLVYLLILQGRVHSLEREIGRLEERLVESTEAADRGNEATAAGASERVAGRTVEPSAPTT
ncbi:MAG: CcmD family protein [Chloroflexi bacterium]|nr:CcmD family protein [Chloroflexota bacterium]MDA1002480.1 CcmD family protein [Chloroflexota bacterium]MQC27836.1 CcmD family protein [Chloroflexota bacterium]